jgi:hypothetical protein
VTKLLQSVRPRIRAAAMKPAEKAELRRARQRHDTVTANRIRAADLKRTADLNEDMQRDLRAILTPAQRSKFDKNVALTKQQENIGGRGGVR